MVCRHRLMVSCLIKNREDRLMYDSSFPRHELKLTEKALDVAFVPAVANVFFDRNQAKTFKASLFAVQNIQ